MKISTGVPGLFISSLGVCLIFILKKYFLSFIDPDRLAKFDLKEEIPVIEDSDHTDHETKKNEDEGLRNAVESQKSKVIGVLATISVSIVVILFGLYASLAIEDQNLRTPIIGFLGVVIGYWLR